MSEEEALVWSFGYGSNMDVKAVEAKKHVEIVDHVAAVLKDHKLAFNLAGHPLSEPAYAGLMPESGRQVHGVAFCMTKSSGDELDKTEAGYDKKPVILEAYDGRKLNGFVYMNKKPSETLHKPSKRYLGVLVKGAKQAGLNPDYVDALSKTETWTAPDWVIDLRAKTRPKNGQGLKLVTKDELAQHKDWTSCLGFVVKPVKIWFPSHKGRDLTSRMLMQYHGIPMDDNDDGGNPPYPLVKDLSEDEVEYIHNWLDHYQAAFSKDEGRGNLGEIIGFHKEFLEQQNSGKSTFKLPEIPN